MRECRDTEFHFSKTLSALSGVHPNAWRLQTHSNWFQRFPLPGNSNRRSICCTPEIISSLYVQKCQPFRVTTFNYPTNGGVLNFADFVRYFITGSGRMGAH